MKKRLQILILVGITLFLYSCSNETTNTEENRIALIEEFIMKSEYGDNVEGGVYVQSESYGEVEKYNVRLMKDNIMDEYSPLKLGEIIERFPTIIEEDLILEIGINPLDNSNNNYEIIEYKIMYDGAMFTKNEYGLSIGDGTLYDPVAVKESNDRQKNLLKIYVIISLKLEDSTYR